MLNLWTPIQDVLETFFPSKGRLHDHNLERQKANIS